jgi:AraC-like DNA-binding protein
MNHSKSQYQDLFRIGYYISPIGGALKPRTIDGHEFYVEMITQGLVFAPDSNMLCGPGWIFIHKNGDQTVSRSPENAHYECHTLLCEQRKVKDPELWPRFFQWIEVDDALSFAREMLFAYHHTSVDREILMDLWLSQMRFRLDQFQRNQEREKIPPRMLLLIQEIESNYMKPILLENLAAKIGISVSHLQAQFKDSIGMSPHQYLIHHRMRVARHQLVTSQDPLKVIASKVGYNNTESFCKAFKKLNGQTADDFRQRYRVYT